MNSVLIDDEHARAICAEVGERLRVALNRPVDLPPYLARLVERFAELDHIDSPSIVPSIESVSTELAFS